MVRHLILLLFLIGLSLPALAAPVHADATTVATSCHDSMPIENPASVPDSNDGKAAGHLCIGCVANPAARALSPPLPLAPAIQHVSAMTTLVGAEIQPSTPPPRA